MTITIVGIGLIGGSLALSLRRTGFGTRFIGVDADQKHCSEAMWLGLVDEILPLASAVQQSDLVILSIPVGAARMSINAILDMVGENTVVVDMGSTKQGICLECKQHPKRKQFVASHPIAGTEYSGPGAAIDHLFENKKTIICDQELSADRALQLVVDMYNRLGMEIIYMPSDKHDKHIAFVSHISHISSFALGLTVLNIEKDEKSIFDMAGSGFSSTVRLAKSSPKTWSPIFLQNAESISYALADYIAQLERFKTCIDTNNAEELQKLMQEANHIGKIIK